MINPNAIKVGDVLYDAAKRSWVRVVGKRTMPPACKTWSQAGKAPRFDAVTVSDARPVVYDTPRARTLVPQAARVRSDFDLTALIGHELRYTTKSGDFRATATEVRTRTMTTPTGPVEFPVGLVFDGDVFPFDRITEISDER